LVPQKSSAADDEFVGMVGVLLVAHVLERADLSSVERNDSKADRIGESAPQGEDVCAVALDDPSPSSRFAPIPPIPRVMAPANRLQALLDLSHKVSSSLELNEVLEAFAERAAELTGATAAELSFWDRDRDCLVMLVEHLQGADEITEEGGQIYRLSDFPATRGVLTSQKPAQIRVSNEKDDPAERALLDGRGQKALLMLPLVTRGETIGLMEIIDVEDRKFDKHDVDFCQALCDVVAIAVRNAMLYSEMQELAARDKLTGLYNRRLFEEQFDAAVARSLRNGEELALLVVDLDGLKRINDLGGHPAGDEALKALSDALLETVRAGDVACRLGGDEFAIILPGATPDDAIKVAERAQEALIARGPYSFSGGVARASANLGSVYDLYRSADIAAYRAKAAGGARTLLGVEARAPA
jgi:diguanylate cyclase (GGDEF)-like protein